MRFSVCVLVVALLANSACRSKAKSSTALSEAVPAQMAADSACADYKSAVTKVATLTGMSADSDLDQALAKYCSLIIPSEVDSKFGRLLLDDLMAQKWGGEITDFVATADLLFLIMNQSLDKITTRHFAPLKTSWRSCGKALTASSVNIALDLLYWMPLICVASTRVRGSWSPSLTCLMMSSYLNSVVFTKGAQIEPLVRFGNPVALNHGNIVVDAAAGSSSRAYRCTSEATSSKYNEGMRFIVDRGDIAVVNMSRAFLGTKKTPQSIQSLRC